MAETQKPSNSEHHTPLPESISMGRYRYPCVLLTIPVTGRGGTQGYETSRSAHFADNRLTDGGEVVSLKYQPRFNLEGDC
jgi:hypothetical protein